MLLYCPKCQYLIDKIEETCNEGYLIVSECPRCKELTKFYVKYKAVSQTIDKKKKNVQ